MWAKTRCFECVALNASELLLPEKRAELQELKLALAVLAFANKHYTINTSLLSLQKTTRFQSQSSDYAVHNKFAFMNYTDGEHGGIKITT